MPYNTNKHKFKYNDIVYVKALIAFDYDLGKIIKFDEERGMYLMIHILDNQSPHSFWCWCYVKEEDIEFAENVLGDVTFYQHCFEEPIKLDKKDFYEFYNENFLLYKSLYNGEITKEKLFKELDRLFDVFIEEQKEIAKKSREGRRWLKKREKAEEERKKILDDAKEKGIIYKDPSDL